MSYELVFRLCYKTFLLQHLDVSTIVSLLSYTHSDIIPFLSALMSLLP